VNIVALCREPGWRAEELVIADIVCKRNQHLQGNIDRIESAARRPVHTYRRLEGPA
jgi:hypothetical protein